MEPMTGRPARTPRRRARAPRALAALLLAPLATLGGAPPQDGATVEEARAALEKMVETRRILSQERRDWAIGRELLQDRIGVVKAEIAALREKLAGVQASVAEADQKRLEKIAANEAHVAASRALREGAAGLEARVRGLLARLPEPIRQRVKPLSQRIPEDPAETQETLSTRFQNVVGILDQVDKFQRDVTVASEVRTLSSGASAEVTALYLGLGQGYYVTANGTAAGIGSAGPEGWTWMPADASAADVARMVAIWKNEEGAAFVRLPIRLANGGSR